MGFKLAVLMLTLFIVVFSAISILLAGHLFLSWDDGESLQDYKCPDCNVILISIDTLRADHLGCYGYHRDTSPSIDRLASEGILFENAFSNSHWTLPSHMSMMTSQYPSVHDVNLHYRYDQRLDESKTTLAEVLKSNGYATAAFTGGGQVAPEFGFGQGFDEYNTIDTLYGNTELLDGIFDWLDKNHDRRFFMFVHTYSAHSPYIPPEPFRGMFDDNYSGNIIDSPEKMNKACIGDCNIHGLFASSINTSDPQDVYHAIALYDEGIRYTDYCIGELLERLDSLDLSRETAIIFTSDHGEDLTEHGIIAEHHDVYDEQTHVPLIIRLPGGDSKRAESLVQSIDITPTILDILDIPPTPGMQGEDLIPMPETDKNAFIERGYFYFFAYYNVIASYTKNTSLCSTIPEEIGRDLCLGQFNISVCSSLQGRFKDVCNRLNQLHKTGNYTHGLYASLILNGILNNRTASETAEEVRKEALKYPEPFHDAAIRNEEFKYIYRHDDQDELYDLIQDPWEQDNIIDERPGISEGLRTELLRWHEENKRFKAMEYSGQSEVYIDQETLEQLKALGYLN